MCVQLRLTREQEEEKTKLEGTIEEAEFEADQEEDNGDASLREFAAVDMNLRPCIGLPGGECVGAGDVEDQRQRGDEQRVVVQRLEDASVQQRVHRASGAAARAVDAGRAIEEALGIDGMAARVDRVEKCRCATAGAGRQGDLRAGGEAGRGRRAAFSRATQGGRSWSHKCSTP